MEKGKGNTELQSVRKSISRNKKQKEIDDLKEKLKAKTEEAKKQEERLKDIKDEVQDLVECVNEMWTTLVRLQQMMY